MTALNCAGCRKCCLGDTITLQPQDNPALYKTKLVNGNRVLAKGKDGNCVYLGKRGCSIHTYAPAMCKAFDCRKYAELFVANPDRPKPEGADDVIAEGMRRLAA